jgi:hypothetical protein
VRYIATLVLLSCILCHPQTASAQSAMAAGVCASSQEETDNDTVVGFFVLNRCSYPIGAYICAFQPPQTSCILQSVIVNGLGTSTVPQSPTIVNNGETFTVSFFECPAGAPTAGSNFSTSLGTPACKTSTSSSIVASTLPNAFAAEVGSIATVFATMENTTSSALSNCRIALAQPAPSGLTMAFQTTNPSTNEPTGSQNTAVSIGAKGSQTFVLSFASTLPLVMAAVPLEYSCDGNVAPLSQAGLSSVDVNFSSSPIANVVAEEETASKNGILTVPDGGSAAFAVSTENAGNAGATVVVQADTGNTNLPLALTLCQTNPSTGACLATPSNSVSLTIAEKATPTFSVFATASGSIAFSPGVNRIFLRFRVSGNEVGATSVAVETN